MFGKKKAEQEAEPPVDWRGQRLAELNAELSELKRAYAELDKRRAAFFEENTTFFAGRRCLRASSYTDFPEKIATQRALDKERFALDIEWSKVLSERASLLRRSQKNGQSRTS